MSAKREREGHRERSRERGEEEEGRWALVLKALDGRTAGIRRIGSEIPGDELHAR